MNRQKQLIQFAKFSAYVLGHRPDEFGLVPDHDGWVKIKEFFQAVWETDGWKHIRRNHINEMLFNISEPSVEIIDNKIRATNRGLLSELIVCDIPPKILYTCIKQKSHFSVFEKGVQPTYHSKVICSVSDDLAKRIGKRRDNHPVLLTVHVKKMMEQGLSFYHAGDLIYLTDFIPPDCFTGPSLPKELPFAKKSEKKPDPAEAFKSQIQAGSFSLSPDKLAEKKYTGKKKEKDTSWKQNKKRLRREKKTDWPEG